MYSIAISPLEYALLAMYAIAKKQCERDSFIVISQCHWNHNFHLIVKLLWNKTKPHSRTFAISLHSCWQVLAQRHYAAIRQRQWICHWRSSSRKVKICTNLIFKNGTEFAKSAWFLFCFFHLKAPKREENWGKCISRVRNKDTENERQFSCCEAGCHLCMFL